MTARDAERRQGAQGDLFDGDPNVGRGRPGRLERAVSQTIRTATKQGQLGDLDKAMSQLAIELARSCDVAARFGGPNLPYALQAAGRELRETLTRLQLDPTARGGGQRDAIDDLIDQLNNAEMGDAAQS